MINPRRMELNMTEIVNIALLERPKQEMKREEPPPPMPAQQLWRLMRIPECRIKGARNREELSAIMENVWTEIARLREECYFAEAQIFEDAFSLEKVREMYPGPVEDVTAVMAG
jgi:hypothetical protein